MIIFPHALVGRPGVLAGEPALGAPFGGGFYAGLVNYGSALYRLIVAPKNTEDTLAWKTDATSSSGASNEVDGWANSSAINNASHPAAQYCRALTTCGKSDWYLPARNELEILFYHFRPGPFVDPSSGNNPNAVPPRANYTDGDPPITAITAFGPGGGEAFEGAAGPSGSLYWSSTQSSASAAFVQAFGNGFVSSPGKTSSRLVRAVRRELIS